nr:reverse transcriptase domain-containing protein [Tanacetum cinerariifolium]
MVRVLSDYDCELHYHLGKANVVADALSRKSRPKPLRVRALIMTIGLNLPMQILNAQVEARKKENYGTEDLCGMIKNLKPRVTGGGQGGARVVQAALHIGEGTAHEVGPASSLKVDPLLSLRLSATNLLQQPIWLRHVVAKKFCDDILPHFATTRILAK